jgi:DNA-binding Xre family transcriptional regulator
MIPAFDGIQGNLPPGIHEATWDEITARFGRTAHRRRLLAGLRQALEALRRAGCRRAYIDGSFVTAKRVPGDFDGCWDAEGVDPDLLDPVLLDFTSFRAAQKGKFGGELFVSGAVADLLESLDDLPVALIRARIATHLTQKALAERLGVKEQQVQRYEATRYAGVTFDRIRAVADALEVRVDQRIILPLPVEQSSRTKRRQTVPAGPVT